MDLPAHVPHEVLRRLLAVHPDEPDDVKTFAAWAGLTGAPDPARIRRAQRVLDEIAWEFSVSRVLRVGDGWVVLTGLGPSEGGHVDRMHDVLPIVRDQRRGVVARLKAAMNPVYFQADGKGGVERVVLDVHTHRFRIAATTLPDVDDRFAGLGRHRAKVEKIFEHVPKGKHEGPSVFRIAAELSLLTGALDAKQKDNETPAKAGNRIMEAFRRAWGRGSPP